MEKKFPFEDEPNTATFVCSHVLNGERPILYVSHDEDGYWQFLCGGQHTEEDAKIVSLTKAFQLDESVGELAAMDYGKTAERESPEDGWRIRP